MPVTKIELAVGSCIYNEFWIQFSAANVEIIT